MRQFPSALQTFTLLTVLTLLGCSPAPEPVDPTPPRCVPDFETGGAEGHPEPFGAKEAKQARAAVIRDLSDVAQPAHGRQRIQEGDFVLVNEHMAVVIEGVGLSDGYGRHGGSILAIDKVGPDGRPMGMSRYVETLFSIGLMEPESTSVSVLADGSDGGPAIVRATGQLQPIPIFTGALSFLARTDLDLQVAYDYILEPGAEKVTYRLSVANHYDFDLDLGPGKKAKDEIFGFFQGNQNQAFTPETGFAEPDLFGDWVGFISGPWNFAFRAPDGPLEYGVVKSGFVLYQGKGIIAESCAITSSDRIDIIAGGPSLDGLRSAIRRVDGETIDRRVEGTLLDANGAPVSNAWIHIFDDDDRYHSRTTTDDLGQFSVENLGTEFTRLVAQKEGYVHQGTSVDADTDSVTLSFEPHAFIAVNATRKGDGAPLPVRVQVIPELPVERTPDTHGVLDEIRGRLHQEFAVKGTAKLVVSPGKHRLIVSRGYEFELFDQTVEVGSLETKTVDVALEHSVDSTGVMCADFHIHSFLSADSNDPVEHKVKGAVADGLDIPVSSEHEWVADFGPTVKKLGLEKWAFGMASLELSTFHYGHFGVVPMEPQRGAYNNGAVDWLGQSPKELFEGIDALPNSPALIVNHPLSSGFQGYFSSAGFDPDLGKGTNEEWDDNFDALEVFNSSSFDRNRSETVEAWFSMLNQGVRVLSVGSSDSHHLRTSPVGYPRTCMSFGHDDPSKLTGRAVRDALLSGKSTISGGLMLRVTSTGDTGPGDTISANGKTPLNITVGAPSFIEASEVEVIVSGKTVVTETLTPSVGATGNQYVIDVQVPTQSGQWIVVHVRGKGDLAPLHPGKEPFAVSNPIWVE